MPSSASSWNTKPGAGGGNTPSHTSLTPLDHLLSSGENPESPASSRSRKRKRKGEQHISLKKFKEVTAAFERMLADIPVKPGFQAHLADLKAMIAEATGDPTQVGKIVSSREVVPNPFSTLHVAHLLRII